MLIVHFSLTPLVGAPIRLCEALGRLDGVEARFVVLDPKGYVDQSHPIDLVWEDDKALVSELVERADILHLHNYISLDSREFAPLDFSALWESGKPMVRHFHSTPDLVARMMRCNVSDVFRCPIPKLTIAQYPERFYPTARLVPNIVLPNQYGIERSVREGPIRIGYSPSSFRSGRISRWDTKGYPETISMLRRLERKAKARGISVEIDVIEQVSHRECLARKSECDIAIDDLVTGSYHMSTLESLELGSMVLTHMDDRVQKAVAEVCGRNDFPAVNVRLEDAEEVLLSTLDRPEMVREIGKYSAEWMAKYWSMDEMASRFLVIYRDVLANPRQQFSQRFDLQSAAGRFLNNEIHDVNWHARHERWPKEPPLLLKKARNLLRKIGIHRV